MTEKKDAFVKNAADPKQVRSAKHKEINKREQELEDIRFILSEPAGRRFYYRFLHECKIFETSMTGNSWTYFNEGARNIGLKLLADLNEADADTYVVMMKENKHGG